MRASTALLVALTFCLAASGCGSPMHPPAGAPPAEARTPQPAPQIELTSEEKAAWAPLPPDRSAIPVLLYHGIGPKGDFSNAADADYGVDREDFAKQMTMLRHSGYRTVDLQAFVDFVHGKNVDLPPRPLLLTFDDARADSWTGADDVLRELHFSAVMFVDVGRVDAGDREYMTWQELGTAEESGRWDLQLHSGNGHVQLKYGAGKDDYGPYYAYKKEGEDVAGWRDRVRSDITWGQRTLAGHDRSYEPLAFAPPYGSYGQDGTNDPRIPDDLLGWLTGRYGAVFTQDRAARAKAGSEPPYGRIQVTRAVPGGDLHDMLLSGEQ